jgi:hypothetical protein
MRVGMMLAGVAVQYTFRMQAAAISCGLVMAGHNTSHNIFGLQTDTIPHCTAGVVLVSSQVSCRCCPDVVMMQFPGHFPVQDCFTTYFSLIFLPMGIDPTSWTAGMASLAHLLYIQHVGI